MLWRVRFGPDFGPKFSKIFAAAKFFIRNCARSRRNPCRLVVRSFLTTLRGPQHLFRASACCGACDLDRISDRNVRKFKAATACRRSTQCLGTSAGRGQAAARGAQRISARLRPQNVVASENFRKIKNFDQKFAENCTESQHHAPRCGVAS